MEGRDLGSKEFLAGCIYSNLAKSFVECDLERRADVPGAKTLTHTYTHNTHNCRILSEVFVISIIDPPWEDKCERHIITRMTGSDCAFMCNLIKKYTDTHNHSESFCPSLSCLLQTRHDPTS